LFKKIGSRAWDVVLVVSKCEVVGSILSPEKQN
jgi:hypothetical protein